ncbi:MAG: flagellar export chaperone FliS [Betaproteobacteria bacterium HGW-Betaproteobacteria-7]|jgi:flagellar protein FliS|nr:MAG: flagellar export chaperone FliS [Betaproteobacteria bacterium HGW-Betaproteobacteria-7]
MGFAPSPIQSYQNVGYETDIRGSDPHRLVILLFEGALSALDRAELSLAAKNYQDKTNALTRAIEIILDGLSASLNMDDGGEVAGNLKLLYEYMASRLTHANFQNDLTAMNEVRGLLTELCGAWKEIAPKPSR